MKKIILWLWQLPQHLLALILIKALEAKDWLFVISYHRTIKYWSYEQKSGISSFLSGVSLGEYIILPKASVDSETLCHEHGHSIQSQYLGWFYLPIVGVYSAVFCNLWDRLFHKGWDSKRRYKWYYSRWCEAWADRAGGVDRR